MVLSLYCLSDHSPSLFACDALQAQGSTVEGYEEGDKELSCMDCNQAFLFTNGEQAFYEEKGFTNEPTRCKPCRAAKKVRLQRPQPLQQWHQHRVSPQPALLPCI